MPIEIETDGASLGASDVRSLCDEAAGQLSAAGRIGILSSMPLAYALGLLAAREARAEAVVIPACTDVEEARHKARDWGLNTLITGLDRRSGRLELESLAPIERVAHSGLSVFTSGTSGTPKLAKHTWETISAAAEFVPERLRARRWYLAYAPASYAGLQVVFSAAAAGGALFVPDRRDIASHVANLKSWRPEVISATPTWWRLVIGNWSGDQRITLEQATLGGEVVHQTDIDAIEAFFSPEGLTHIYASTEAGTAIVVSDRKAGFPAHWIDTDRPVRLRIIDGLLHLQTARRMVDYESGQALDETDGWINTHDIAEIRGDRCYLLGRADGLVNVGGRKIRPEEVEAAIARLDDVVDSIVYAKANPVTGTILAADVVLRDTSALDVRTMKIALAEWLPPGKIPAMIRMVNELKANPNGKKARRQ